MALATLGPGLDLHCGGADLAFPHHAFEAAQAEAVTGVAPFARAWLRAGMVTRGGEKMAKSTGNLVFVDDVLKDATPAALRLLICQRRWWETWEFDVAELPAAEARVVGLRHAAARTGAGDEARSAVVAALADDLDVPLALALAEDAGGRPRSSWSTCSDSDTWSRSAAPGCCPPPDRRRRTGRRGDPAPAVRLPADRRPNQERFAPGAGGRCVRGGAVASLVARARRRAPARRACRTRRRSDGDRLGTPLGYTYPRGYRGPVGLHTPGGRVSERRTTMPPPASHRRGERSPWNCQKRSSTTCASVCTG